MAKTRTAEKIATGTTLARKLETYRTHLPRLVHQEGKFVLVHDTNVVDVYDTYRDALAAGYEKFGVDKPFLVKQISSVERPLVGR